MRPRHYAAENTAAITFTGNTINNASMRPRHYAAENVLDVALGAFSSELQ